MYASDVNDVICNCNVERAKFRNPLGVDRSSNLESMCNIETLKKEVSNSS